MKIGKVLVAIDFSPPSTVAVNHGIAFARRFNATLALVHVVDSPPGLMYPFPGDRDLEHDRSEQAYRMLTAMVSPEDQDDLSARFVVRTGEIQEVIESIAQEEQADVVVMGTHGRGLFKRMLMGSVTQGLLRKLGVPVLTVCGVSRPLQFKRILFATDFGVDSSKAFRYTLDLAAATHASVVLAHTMELRPILTYETAAIVEALERAREDAKRQAEERCAECRSDAARKGVRLECVLNEGPDAAASLIAVADQHDVDFIVLGLRQKRFVDRVLLGSTAEPVIRGAHVPVLSVPIDAKVEIVEDMAAKVGGEGR